MSKNTIVASVIAVVMVAVIVGLSSCGGGGDTGMYFNISERASWSADGRFAFASFGGNGLLYTYSVNESGGGTVLLTPSDNDEDLADEGGWHPAYSPDGGLIAFASRRGPSPAIWIMDGAVGDRTGLSRLTDDSGLGSDEQPSWSPDASSIVYTSTRSNNNHDIRVINADGSGQADLLATAAEEQWASYNPQNADQIVFQSDQDAAANGDTDIFVYTISTQIYQKLADSLYTDSAPAWSPDGTKIAFHSNRSGDFDIWVVDATGGDPTPLTTDARSDGFPIWNSDGTRIAFTRSRELWSMAADGTDEEQITRRF